MTSSVTPRLTMPTACFGILQLIAHSHPVPGRAPIRGKVIVRARGAEIQRAQSLLALPFPRFVKTMSEHRLQPVIASSPNVS